MRMIGTLGDEQSAAGFSDYLLTRNIDAHIEESASGWQVWVEHDDDLDRAREELRVYTTNPGDPRFAASSAAAKIRRDREKAEEKRRQNYTEVRTRWSGPAGGTRVTVTLVLIGLSVLVTLLTQFGKAGFENPRSPLNYLLFDNIHHSVVEVDGRQFVDQSHTMFSSVARGELWRLVTPIFLHFSPLHILFNMLWMWQLGAIIESRKGSLTLVLLVVATAIISNSAEAAWMTFYRGGEWAPFGGMSGVVGGLLGYAWMKGKYEPYDGIGVAQQTVWFMLAWFVICSFGWVGDIANAAHWTGLLTGVLFVLIPRMWRRRRRA